MRHTRWKALLLVLLTVAFVGLGVLFYTAIDVGRASQYAGISSFLVSVLTAIMSAILFFKTVASPKQSGSSTEAYDRADAPDDLPRSTSHGGSKSTTIHISDCTSVQTGKKSVANINQLVEPREATPSKRSSRLGHPPR
ncbi:hypothetical protein VA596_43505 [Amycolatopsis sp., V23-08]|uniref:Uncharacterized protein n=1 Tax=Amycolatopsis heterodermiae TaxID=3110235 RepID=A0ABU5RJJ1_9PSEU|nr:hypothetical protein [Amycolatopsis sp., V23-08]MEA5366461.1 hypothetical protein [Amycolatopsis sp., V23-08]